VIGSRTEAVVAVVVGLAVVTSYLWFPHLALLFAGAFMASPYLPAQNQRLAERASSERPGERMAAAT
jgi:hypothetical protein